MMWSYDAFTSFDVITLPSWNFTPWRTLNVYVRWSWETVHDSARSPTNLVPVLSVGSTRISVLYCGAVGCSMANVSSRCASKLGGSAATMKISSPPLRGLSWATAGVASANMTTRARQATIDTDVVRNLMTAASRTRKGAGTIARPAGASRQAG